LFLGLDVADFDSIQPQLLVVREKKEEGKKGSRDSISHLETEVTTILASRKTQGLRLSLSLQGNLQEEHILRKSREDANIIG